MRFLKYVLAALFAFAAFELLYPSLSCRPEPREESLARNDVTQLSVALSAFKSEYKSFPEGSIQSILDQLQGNNPKGIVFIELAKRRINSEGMYLDPWNRPYQIRLNNLKKPHIWSLGKNGLDDTSNLKSDDIRSWE